jgi:hypothetical protein
MVDAYHPVLLMQGPGDAAADAQGVLAVAAGHGVGDPVVPLHPDPGTDGLALQGFHHVAFAGIGKGAVEFAQMAPQAPFFVHIYSFHHILLI